MNQIPVAVLAVACFVLAVDLVTTYLRRRVRTMCVTSEPPLTEEKPESESTG
jgi:hypothetical protein